MGKPDFTIPASKDVWKLLEKASAKTHHDTPRAFNDFLTMSVCALSGGQMEDEYLKTVERYTEGEKGKRACDNLAHAFGVLVNAMEETRQDILGDLFMGGVTYGQNGQFFTPEPICTMMTQMTFSEETEGKRILDPACGSGRTLLAMAEVNRNNEFWGQDLDHRCVQMTAINLGLRNLYGYVLHGDSLKMDVHRAYRTGLNGKGVIAEVEDVNSVAPVVRRAVEETTSDNGSQSQLSLF